MMLRFFLALLCSLLLVFLSGQTVNWQQLAPMPEAVSNNAVATAETGDVQYVYSFAGIDTTKDWFGIHLRSFRYNTISNSWDTIPPLPDPNGGKIAAAASNVKGKIYIIGGYHVASNYSEISSSKVHIFAPQTNTYLPDGTDIPVPIDDQVQAVWRDSLIYVITGWSNSNNVNNVQIYNPATDSWAAGTPVPNNSQYKVFGASGTIIGDTIYYTGGARFAFNFPATTYFRKGYINPEDPIDITWESIAAPAAKGYRMAATQYDGQALWIGGSDITYNFDGIAYNGSGGVPPLGRLKLYSPASGQLTEFSELFPPLMDLRGVADIGNNQYILAGGMLNGQEVTDQTLMLTIDQLSASSEADISLNWTTALYPNPAEEIVFINLTEVSRVRIFSMAGNFVKEFITSGHSFPASSLPRGLYIIELWNNAERIGLDKLIIH